MKPALIGLLVKKTKESKNFFDELNLIDLKKDNVNKTIEDAANDVLKDEHTIFNSQ